MASLGTNTQPYGNARLYLDVTVDGYKLLAMLNSGADFTTILLE
jgi:hypothetical protein